jgi:hypothetical protein
MEVRKIKISPGVLKNDIISETSDGFTFGIYSGLTQILSGGTNGESLLTQLAIPVTLTQTYHDIGYYEPTDGFVLQLSKQINFVFSSTTTSPNTYNVYLTTNQNEKYFDNFVYTVDWGDGSAVSPISVYSPESISHNYTNPNKYSISLSGTGSLGSFIVKKNVTVPYEEITITNPYGQIIFTELGGSWADTPTVLDTIFTGDSINNVYLQSSSNFVSVPFVISGYTESLYDELLGYGIDPNPLPNKVVQIIDGVTGKTDYLTPSVTAYTINDIQYFDYLNGTTIYSVNSSGMTPSMMSQSAITKNEAMMNIVDQPVIQVSGIIERGKNSAMQNFLRIGEVDSTGDVTQYGYNFFTIERY